MADPNYKEVIFDILGGQNSVDNPGDISQIPRQPQLGTLDPGTPVRMAQAQDVYAPNDRYDLATRPGFGNYSSAFAISGTNGICTGLIDQGDIASRFLSFWSVAGQRHTAAQGATPTEISLSTNFTIGQDNLICPLNFTDGTNLGTICLSRLRDLPQFINASGVASNLTIAGTGLTSLKPGFGEIFGKRAVYGDVDVDGTVRNNRYYWTDLRDANLITDPTTQFDSLDRKTADKLRGMRLLSDLLLIGSRDYLSFLAITTVGSLPFRSQDVPIGASQGPMSHQGMINAGAQRVAWNAMSGIFALEGSQGEVTKEWTKPLKSYWVDSLEPSRMDFVSAGYDHQSNIGVWAVTTTGGSSHNRVIGINFSTGENYVWTLTRNAFGIRISSGQQQLMGGGVTSGRIFNEVQTSVFTGNAEDASAAIDADVITPHHHCGMPNVKKLFLGIKVWFKNQSTSEAVTVQWRLNTTDTWSSFGDSPYTVSTTSEKPKFFRLVRAGYALQVRFRDANSGQAMRIQKYSIVFKPMGIGVI